MRAETDKSVDALNELLRGELLKVKDQLGADSQRRIESNPLRVLDSKVEELRTEAPFEEYKKCSAAQRVSWDGEGCERRFVDFFAAYPNRRWMPGIICLLFFLPFYVVAVLARNRLGTTDVSDPKEWSDADH